MKRLSTVCGLLLLLGCIAGCSTVKAPVSARQGPEKREVDVESSAAAPRVSQRDKATRHTVTKGDTLYSIAWRYGHDYKALAAWNRIESPFTIYPGQVISLVPVRKSQTLRPAPAAKKQSRKPGRTADTTAGTSSPNKRAAPAPAAPELAAPGARIRWQWPARGKLLKASTPTAKKGISIGGQTGQKIVAAATGRVVYSGSGLRGYGNLVIIKHSETYLSAYAHNRELVVKEGDAVKAGQQISTMGVDGKGAPLLHFEIRKNGKPIDPLGQLPRT